MGRLASGHNRGEILGEIGARSGETGSQAVAAAIVGRAGVPAETVSTS